MFHERDVVKNLTKYSIGVVLDISPASLVRLGVKLRVIYRSIMQLAKVTNRRQPCVVGVVVTLVLLLSACGGAQIRPWVPANERDSHDNPDALRPGYGRAGSSTWWPMAATTAAVLKRIDKARSGDATALLALAILASGEQRDADAWRAIEQRVDNFVAELKPVVNAAVDDRQRGYELHRAMHRVFLNGVRGELGSYRLEQSRVTGIFETGQHNCISSAMLFVVLARAFNLPVRGVLVPTHAFVEIGTPHGKIIEVETTSEQGFDVVHDERFYKEAAANWSRSRALRPLTIEEYRRREILEPYRLIAMGMINQAGQPGTSDVQRGQLVEMAALIDPDSVEVQRVRTLVYAFEAHQLFDLKAARTLAKMFDVIGPELEVVTSKFATNSEMMRAARWAEALFADALQVVGRSQEAAALADDALPLVDLRWEDSAALRSSFMNVFIDQMLTLMTQKDYARAVQVMSKRMQMCRSAYVCAHDLEVVYSNWSAEYQYVGKWQSARSTLQECVALLPNEVQCRYALKYLEATYRF